MFVHKHACVCVCFYVHCPVCVFVRACVCMCIPSVLHGRNPRGGGWKMIRGPIHMKQEGSYINIAPRPRGQAIYEANCSPVSHGGRTVYYAWGLVTCFKAVPKTGMTGPVVARCWLFLSLWYSFLWKYVVGEERIIVLFRGAAVRSTVDAAQKAKYW